MAYKSMFDALATCLDRHWLPVRTREGFLTPEAAGPLQNG